MPLSQGLVFRLNHLDGFHLYAHWQGTDQTYLQKQHDALSGHPAYVKGEDRTKWDRGFGIRHFAGEVYYQIVGFLDKNKDTQQDLLFEYMQGSKNVFVKDLTRFQVPVQCQLSAPNLDPLSPLLHTLLFAHSQDLLTQDRRIIMGQRARDRRQSSAVEDSTRTNKAKPTVGDTFRRQLASLVEVLESTTPW